MPPTTQAYLLGGRLARLVITSRVSFRFVTTTTTAAKKARAAKTTAAKSATAADHTPAPNKKLSTRAAETATVTRKKVAAEKPTAETTVKATRARAATKASIGKVVESTAFASGEERRPEVAAAEASIESSADAKTETILAAQTIPAGPVAKQAVPKEIQSPAKTEFVQTRSPAAEKALTTGHSSAPPNVALPRAAPQPAASILKIEPAAPERPKRPKRIDQSSPEYRTAKWKWISTIVALPILIVTSKVLFERLALGKDKGALLTEGIKGHDEVKAAEGAEV